MLTGVEVPLSPPNPPEASTYSQDRHEAGPRSAADSPRPRGETGKPVCRGHLEWIWPELPDLSEKPGQRATLRTQMALFSGLKTENNFNLKARLLQRKSLLSPAQFAPGWFEFTQCMCVCFSWLLSASPGLDSCRLHSEGPLNLGGYSFPHICYKFSLASAFKGSFMEPSAVLWLLPIKPHTPWHTSIRRENFLHLQCAFIYVYFECSVGHVEHKETLHRT